MFPQATKDEAAPASTEALSPKKSRPRPITFDAQAIRTLVISNTPKDVTTSTLWKKIRKQDGAESVEWPVKDPRTGQVLPGVAHALFKDPASAQAALAKLHAHVYKGCMLSAALKKRVDALQRVNASEGKVAGPSRAGRLIIRNLPWNVSLRPFPLSPFLMLTLYVGIDIRERLEHPLSSLRANTFRSHSNYNIILNQQKATLRFRMDVIQE